MKRYLVTFRDNVFSEWVWAENKRAARKQMTPYANSRKDKITSIEEINEIL